MSFEPTARDADQKHTPGPWVLSYSGGDARIMSPDGDILMCDMTYYPWVPGKVEDWNLIAAAPELLEVLELALEYMEANDGEYDCFDKIIKARAAIAKAKGEKP